MRYWIAIVAIVAITGFCLSKPSLILGTASSKTTVRGVVSITSVVTSVTEHEGITTTVKRLRDRHGHVIGWGDTVCFDLHNSSSQCIGTFVLPLGKINIAGTRHNQTYFVLAIVGGTGIYSGAGGVLVGNTIRVPPRVERLQFFLE